MCRMSRKGAFANFGRLVKFLIPFVILIIYTCGTAGIVLTVEQSYFDTYSNSCSIHLPATCAWSVGPNGMWSAIHFVFTLITTIGYGDIAPCSPGGRALSIIIALIGMPLTLVCLTRLGMWLESTLNSVWSKMTLMCCARSKKKRSIKPKSAQSHDDNEEENVPLTLGLLLTVFWILICTAYFYNTLLPFYEDKQQSFTFGGACYFTLISLLTIGLGDIAPLSYNLVFANFFFIIIGLALASMCINIVQTKLEHMFENAIKAIQHEYQKSVLEQEEGTQGLDNKKAKEHVNKLLNKDPNAKWLSSLMSDSQKKKLVGEYQKKARMIIRSTQTDLKTQDATSNTDRVETKDEACFAYPGGLRVPQY